MYQLSRDMQTCINATNNQHSKGIEKQSSSLYENIKRLCKNMKKRCPPEIKLHQVQTAFARGLGYSDWHDLQAEVCNGLPTAFSRRIKKFGSAPDDSEFTGLVERFADACGMDVAAVSALCAEFLLVPLEKWQARADSFLSVKPTSELDAKDTDSFPYRGSSLEMVEVPRGIVCASTAEGRTLMTERIADVPVTVRRRRHVMVGNGPQ